MGVGGVPLIIIIQLAEREGTLFFSFFLFLSALGLGRRVACGVARTWDTAEDEPTRTLPSAAPPAMLLLALLAGAVTSERHVAFPTGSARYSDLFTSHRGRETFFPIIRVGNLQLRLFVFCRPSFFFSDDKISRFFARVSKEQLSVMLKRNTRPS